VHGSAGGTAPAGRTPRRGSFYAQSFARAVPMSIVTEAPAATVAADPSPRDELPDHVMSSVQEFITPFFFGHGPNADGGLAMYGGSSGRRSFLREIEARANSQTSPGMDGTWLSQTPSGKQCSGTAPSR
jgi:hypothetical protein